jgi:hypothetical protein
LPIKLMHDSHQDFEEWQPPVLRLELDSQEEEMKLLGSPSEQKDVLPLDSILSYSS